MPLPRCELMNTRWLLTLGVLLGASGGQSSAQNRVLHLNGQGAHVVLPDEMFKALDEATMECWIRFERFNRDSRVFTLGERGHEIYLRNSSLRPDLKCLITVASLIRYRIDVGGAWRLGQWCHVAVVTGRRGFELYPRRTAGASAATWPAFSAKTRPAVNNLWPK